MFKYISAIIKISICISFTIIYGAVNVCWATTPTVQFLTKFTSPQTVLVDSSGQSNAVSNVFTQTAVNVGGAPLIFKNMPTIDPDTFANDPGPFTIGIAYENTGESINVNGHMAVPMSDNYGPKTPLYIIIGFSAVDDLNIVYADGNIGNQNYQWMPVPDQNKPFNFRTYQQLVSSAAIKSIPGVYTLGEAEARLLIKSVSTGRVSPYIYGTVTDHMTITIVSSTCMVQTPRDISINWPSIAPSVIKNYNAEVKPASIQVACENNITDMLVTVSSSNGSSDAVNGIVNTNKNNLGLKLTWASDGQPVVLDQQRNFGPAQTRDFTINAQPVATGSGDISAGGFSTDVTVTLEYR